MKKLHLSLCLLMIVTLFSCGSDDNDNDTPEINSELLAKWGQVSFSQQGEVMTITDCEKRSTIEFTTQLFTEISYAPVNTDCQIDGQYSGTWTQEGNVLTLTYTDEGETFVDIATFTLVDNKLTIKYDDEGFITEFGYEKL